MPTEVAELNNIVLPDTLEQAIRAGELKHIDRINAAWEVAKTFVSQIEDPEYQRNMTDKLTRSYVHGSRIEGIRTYDDVASMLNAVTNWKVLNVVLPDDKITCFQGTLPPEYEKKAYAAYSTVREIEHYFGNDGVRSIQAKKGYQRTDEFYFCTTLSVPTDIVTVQLKVDEVGTEFFKQWFAGREKSSIFRSDDGDTLVRCSSKIPMVNGKGQGKRYRPRN